MRKLVYGTYVRLVGWQILLNRRSSANTSTFGSMSTSCRRNGTSASPPDIIPLKEHFNIFVTLTVFR